MFTNIIMMMISGSATTWLPSPAYVNGLPQTLLHWQYPVKVLHHCHHHRHYPYHHHRHKYHNLFLRIIILQVARLNTNSVWNPSTKNLPSQEYAAPSNPLGVTSTVVRSNKGPFGWELCSLRCVKHIVTQCNSALVKKILSDYNTLKQCYYQESFVRILLVCIEISTMLDYPIHLWHIVENKIDILISEAQPSQCDDTFFRWQVLGRRISNWIGVEPRHLQELTLAVW